MGNTRIGNTEVGRRAIEYTAAERFWLGLVAGIGFFGVNGLFVYGTLLSPGAFREAVSNPIGAAFMLEALLLLAVLAYLLKKWKVARLSWPWFVLLSLLGGIAFGLPVVLLWGGNRVNSSSE